MMKKMKWGLMALLVLMTTTLSAQQKPEDKRQERQELSEKKAKYIAQQLGLDGQTTQRFEELYRKQQQEVWALVRGERGQRAERSDAEVEQDIKARFERSERMLAIRKKYYDEYRRFLSPQQIERMYELDRQAMGKLRRDRGQGAGGVRGLGKRQGKLSQRGVKSDSLRAYGV